MMLVWNPSRSHSTMESCMSDPGLHRNINHHGFIIVGPASTVGAMKDSPWSPGAPGCPETYHGTRMNKRALDFHTQLHDWSDAQRLTSLRDRPRTVSAKSHTDIYLPVKRLAQIEHWTKDVNKYYRPSRGPKMRSGSFMVIDVSKFNLKTEKLDQSRIKSAVYPSQSKLRVMSAVSSAPTGGPRRFFGTDVHTVNNKLIDTQMHYSAQRRNLYSASTKKSLTTEKNQEEETKEDSNHDVHNKTESDTLSTNDTSIKPSEPPDETPVHLAKEVLQPQITARSWSNKMLNVISIDDCKLSCRYRPQTIKETHETPRDIKTHGNDENDETTKGSRKGKKDKSIEEPGEASGAEADDEEESDAAVDITESKLNGLHITNGIDTNNNENVENLEDAKGIHSETDTNIGFINAKDGESSGYVNSENVNSNKTSTSTTSSGESHKKAKVNFKPEEKESSRTASDKTSYGRITNLYSATLVTSNTKERKKKKQTRAYKINHAINDMVKGRTVMNSMERDFDTRTSQFGRTIVEKSEGSETFQKLHSNLRRKIDSYLDTHSAIKTQQFYDQRRKNSEDAPLHRKNGMVNNK